RGSSRACSSKSGAADAQRGGRRCHRGAERRRSPAVAPRWHAAIVEAAMTEIIRPFRIDIASETLRDLQQRLAATRWPQHPRGLDWEAGASHDYLRTLVDHWRERYDWRSQEAALNRFPQFTASVDDVAIHFVHERGKGPRPFPLLLSHGYP